VFSGRMHAGGRPIMKLCFSIHGLDFCKVVVDDAMVYYCVDTGSTVCVPGRQTRSRAAARPPLGWDYTAPSCAFHSDTA
jgi:hypothetical protein